MADEWVLNEGERLDDLVRDDMKLIQRPDHFCFSVDSVLLAHYVEPKKNDVIADLGTGTGVIALLVSSLGGNHIAAFELDPVMADLARRNVEGIIKKRRSKSLKEITGNLPGSSIPKILVLANPPYREVGTGRMSAKSGVASASYEMNATMDDVFKTAQYLLKYGGRLAMVHRADRTADLITIGRKYHMEPKRMRFVYARKGHTAVRVLIEWRYGGMQNLS